jgi:hypothetical protein
VKRGSRPWHGRGRREDIQGDEHLIQPAASGEILVVANASFRRGSQIVRSSPEMPDVPLPREIVAEDRQLKPEAR